MILLHFFPLKSWALNLSDNIFLFLLFGLKHIILLLSLSVISNLYIIALNNHGPFFDNELVTFGCFIHHLDFLVHNARVKLKEFSTSQLLNVFDLIVEYFVVKAVDVGDEFVVASSLEKFEFVAIFEGFLVTLSVNLLSVEHLAV